MSTAGPGGPGRSRRRTHQGPPIDTHRSFLEHSPATRRDRRGAAACSRRGGLWKLGPGAAGIYGTLLCAEARRGAALMDGTLLSVRAPVPERVVRGGPAAGKGKNQLAIKFK